MGARLVTSFIDGEGKRVATLYQHWSAYTQLALLTVQQIMERMEELIDFYDSIGAKTSDLQIILQSILETQEGSQVKAYIGLDPALETEKTLEYLREVVKLPMPIIGTLRKDKDGHLLYNRNAGIIDICKDEMDDAYRWADGEVTITCSMKDHKVTATNFDVLGISHDKDELEEYEDLGYKYISEPKDPFGYAQYSILKNLYTKELTIEQISECKNLVDYMLDNEIHRVVLDGEDSDNSWTFIHLIA